MTYYPTIDEDLARAKEILAKGKADWRDLPTADALEQIVNQHQGTIYGADIYAAYQLLESFVAEIERLTRENHSLRTEKRQQLQLLTAIREMADAATGTNRTAGDPRDPGALGAVKLLVERLQEAQR